MTVSETMKDHMNAVRSIVGENTLLSIQQATELLSLYNSSFSKKNLIVDSLSFSKWFKNDTIIISNEKSEGIGKIATIKPINRWGDFGVVADIKQDTDYTWSIYAKADNSSDIVTTGLWGKDIFNAKLTTSWKKYEFHGHSTAVIDAYGKQSIYFSTPESNKGNVYITLPCLQEGNSPTSWKPTTQELEKLMGGVVNLVLTATFERRCAA